MLRLSRIQKALWIAAILASFVFAILKSGLWSALLHLSVRWIHVVNPEC